PRDAALVEQHAGGDEIGVEPDVVGAADEFLEVRARRRLAAGEVDLQHAHRRRLVDGARPFRRRQFLARALEIERVGAIGALQGTAMGELGQQRQRRRDLIHRLITPLSAKSCSMLLTSRRMTSRGALNLAASPSTMAVTEATPSQRWTISSALA